jgi:hypothetical protein
MRRGEGVGARVLLMARTASSVGACAGVLERRSRWGKAHAGPPRTAASAGRREGAPLRRSGFPPSPCGRQRHSPAGGQRALVRGDVCRGSQSPPSLKSWKTASEGGFFSTNNQMRFSAFLVLIAGIVKIAMACLLSLFVPQKCVEKDNPEKFHVCSLEENVTDLTPYNTFVLVVNFLTLAVYLAAFVTEYWRELFIIASFDHSDTLPGDNLKDELYGSAEFEAVARKYDEVSLAFLILEASTGILVVLNAVASGVLVFHYYFLDAERTAVIFASYLLLVVGRVYSNTLIAWRCYSEKVALSVALVENLNLNTMDAKLKRQQKIVHHMAEAVRSQAA